MVGKVGEGVVRNSGRDAGCHAVMLIEGAV